MNLYNGIERRRSKRVTYPFEVWYKDRNKNNQGFKHAYGKDISEHGLLFETYEDFPPCTILEIKLELPAPGANPVPPAYQDDLPGEKSFPLPVPSNAELTGFNVLAEVVHSEEIKRQWLYHIGVSFCKVDDDCRRLLKEYVFKGSDGVEYRREIISVT